MGESGGAFWRPRELVFESKLNWLGRFASHYVRKRQNPKIVVNDFRNSPM